MKREAQCVLTRRGGIQWLKSVKANSARRGKGEGLRNCCLPCAFRVYLYISVSCLYSEGGRLSFHHAHVHTHFIQSSCHKHIQLSPV